MVKIGYQGIEGSFNHMAAIQFAKRIKVDKFELVPLKNSQNVANAIKSGRVKFGIAAFQNSIAGIVEETYNAFSIEGFEHYDNIVLPINHCLFIKPNCAKSDIRKIISHEMALKQCSNYVSTHFPSAETVAVGDTASAAKAISTHEKLNDTAVICSIEAGNLNGLKLFDQAIQNHLENYTEFRVYKKRNVRDQIPFKYKLLSLLYNDEKPEIVINIFIVLLIFSLFIFYELIYNAQDPYGAATLFGGIISTLTVMLSSKKLRRNYSQSYLTGYFVYHAISDSGITELEQRYSIPRVVKIFRENEEVKINIFIADRASLVFAQSTFVIHSELSLKHGRLTYGYERGDKSTTILDFKGVVNMQWRKVYKWDKILNLHSRYYGEATNDLGSVHYHRICKEEYERIKSLNYIKSAPNN